MEEKIINLYFSLNGVTSFCFSACKYIILLFLIGTFFRGRTKKESFNLLYVSNCLMAWVSLLCLLSILLEFYYAWYGQHYYETWAFFEVGPAYDMRLFWTRIFLSTMIGLVLFIRKLRTRRIIIVLVLLIQNIWLLEHWISPYTEFLPSSWSVPLETPFKIYTIYCFVLLLWFVFIYWRAKKKNRLPYPSVFLK